VPTNLQNGLRYSLSQLQNVSFASPTELVGCARSEQALAQNIASKQVAKYSQKQRKVGSRRAWVLQLPQSYSNCTFACHIFGQFSSALSIPLPAFGGSLHYQRSLGTPCPPWHFCVDNLDYTT